MDEGKSAKSMMEGLNADQAGFIKQLLNKKIPVQERLDRCIQELIQAYQTINDKDFNGSNNQPYFEKTEVRNWKLSDEKEHSNQVPSFDSRNRQ